MRLDVTPKISMARSTLSDVTLLLEKQGENHTKFIKEATSLVGQISAQIDCLIANNRLVEGNQHIEASALIGELSKERDRLLDLLKIEKN